MTVFDKICWGGTGHVNSFTFGRIWEERIKVIKPDKRETTEILTNWLSYVWAVEQFRSPENPRQRNTQPLARPFPQDSNGHLWKDWEACLCSEGAGGAPRGPIVLGMKVLTDHVQTPDLSFLWRKLLGNERCGCTNHLGNFPVGIWSSSP